MGLVTYGRREVTTDMVVALVRQSILILTMATEDEEGEGGGDGPQAEVEH